VDKVRRVSLPDAVSLFESVFAALNHSGARYVVVGGVATVLHGHARLTADIDLIVDLAPAAARAVVEALAGLGLRPRAHVPLSAFADPAARAEWVRGKSMKVFSLWDPANPMREVDLFLEHPLPFDELWARAIEVTLDTTTVRIASLDDLILLKRLAGRPEDLQDIAALEFIRERHHQRNKP
jgi:predicted nucleotidyltransferase